MSNYVTEAQLVGFFLVAFFGGCSVSLALFGRALNSIQRVQKAFMSLRDYVDVNREYTTMLENYISDLPEGLKIDLRSIREKQEALRKGVNDGI